MSYINDLTYRVLIDGQGTSYPVRKKLKFAGSTLVDDNKNDQTIVTTNSTGGQDLETVCNVGNAAYSTITHLYDPTDPMDAVNLRTLQNYIALDFEQVLTNGNTSGGVHVNLTEGSYIFSSDGYVGINSIVDAHDKRIWNVATPVQGKDAVNLDYLTSSLGALTLAQVLMNGNVASTYIDMSGNYISELSSLIFGNNRAVITQSATPDIVVNADELLLGDPFNPSIIVPIAATGDPALRVNGPLVIKEQGISHYPDDGHSFEVYQSRLIAHSSSDTSSYTIVPLKGANGASEEVRQDKMYGGFILEGSTNTVVLNFTKWIHGAVPVAYSQITGKFLIGWVGNDGGTTSCGAALELLVGVFIDGSNNIQYVYTSIGGTVAGIPGVPNGFTAINSGTTSGYSGLIPDMLEITPARTNDYYTLTIRAPNNGTSGLCKCYWTFEIGGLFQ